MVSQPHPLITLASSTRSIKVAACEQPDSANVFSDAGGRAVGIRPARSGAQSPASPGAMVLMQDRTMVKSEPACKPPATSVSASSDIASLGFGGSVM